MMELENAKVYVKENPATYLVGDAHFALESARSAKRSGENDMVSRFSRMAVLLYAFSLEGFINFVYEYSEVDKARWAKLPFKDKWLRASRLCLPMSGIIENEEGVVLYRPGDAIESFRENAEPFLSFLELKNFRNSVVHLKPPFADVPFASIDKHLNREEYFPISGLPKYLQHVSLEHAETASRIYGAMTVELDRQMKGTIREMFEQEEGTAWIEYVVDDERVWDG